METRQLKLPVLLINSSNFQGKPLKIRSAGFFTRFWKSKTINSWNFPSHYFSYVIKQLETKNFKFESASNFLWKFLYIHFQQVWKFFLKDGEEACHLAQWARWAMPTSCTIFFPEQFLTLLCIYFPKNIQQDLIATHRQFFFVYMPLLEFVGLTGRLYKLKKEGFSCVTPAWLNQIHQQKRLYIRNFCVFGLINPVCELCLYQAFQNYYELPDSFQIVSPHQINVLYSQPQVPLWALTSVFVFSPWFHSTWATCFVLKL